MKKKLITFLFTMVVISLGYGQEQSPLSNDGSLQTFPLSSVSLLPSPFYDAQQTDMEYMLALDPDRLLAPFWIDAGIEPKAARYPNWESSGLDGHIGGHYLSALSFMYAATHNEALLERLNYMVGQLARCQEKNGNGYVGGIPGGQDMWKEVAKGNIAAGNFSLNGKWVPLYNIHKLFAGLRDAYLVTGNEEARDVLIKLSDWLIKETDALSPDQFQEMLRSEHGGMNEVLADVAAITGEKKYLALAVKFSHKQILDPLLHHKDKLTGLHANTQIPKVIGFEQIGEMKNDSSWVEAARFFWNTVVENRTVSIGGNSVREHFNSTDDFSSMIESNQGPETCNTYNMLHLTQSLFLNEPEAKYIDYYERALYNHILSSQNPKGGFVYFTPMRPRHYRVYSQPQQGFWCCVGSGLENHGKYGELIYAHQDEDIYVNLFIPSVLNWEEKGLVLKQNTKFPYEETSQIELKLDKPAKFKMSIRYPEWVKKGAFKVKVNNKPVEIVSSPSSYVTIERKWKNGDQISIALPMHNTVEYMPDSSPWISFVHGPMVLAAVTDSTNLTGLWADDSRMGHVANGKLYPIDEAPMVVVDKGENIAAEIQPLDKSTLTFSAPELIYPDQYKSLKLVPFYTIHEARYMIYWPVVNRENLDEKLQNIREKEEALLALRTRTIDRVAPGEQQPEVEHNFEGEKTATGVNNGRFWRDAEGWFSYELKDSNQEGEVLRITYFGGDKGRKFDILVNGILLESVHLDAPKGNAFFDVDYQIPQKIKDSITDGILKVKFVAGEGSIAGGVYDVRLLR